jgi:phosphatidylserine decarboxylase
MNQRLGLALVKLLPKNALSRAVGRLARARISRVAIPRFAKTFNIDLTEAAKDISEYTTLVEFFTRELKPGIRPVDPDPGVLVSPVDGRVAQFGRLDRGELIQAKGVTYTATQLLADAEMARRYEGGYFITIYLSPRDYHRIHTPAAGEVVAATYVPGALWPVNAIGVEGVPGLFAKNERLITYLETEFGRVAVVKVGATIVGSVKVVYDETLGTNVRGGRIARRTYAGPNLAKAAELGRFEFGSTVILLVEPGRLEWAPGVQHGAFVRLGEALLRRVAQ